MPRYFVGSKPEIDFLRSLARQLVVKTEVQNKQVHSFFVRLKKEAADTRITSRGWGETAKYCIIRPSHVPPESGLCYEPDSLGVKSIEKVRIDVKMNRSCFHIYSYLAMVFYTQWIWFITQTTLWRDVGGANNTEHGALASTLSSNTWKVAQCSSFVKLIKKFYISLCYESELP